jgi:hypothetical protein
MAARRLPGGDVLIYYSEIMKGCFVFSLFIAATFLFSGCAADSGPAGASIQPLGVWWWSSSLIQDPRYFDFAVENHVTEIYLARPESDIGDFGPEIEAFIEKAKGRGIRVYLLLGFGYITYEYPRLREALYLYKDYQARVPENRRYDGIHLDIEFHADHPEWNDEDKRPELLTEYLILITRLRAEIPETPMDIDIPAWFDQIVEYKGAARPLYRFLIDTADRVCVMAYRDTAEAMYEIAGEEVAYARQTGKPIMLGAEAAKDPQWDHVSYAEEGRRYLYEQLELLKNIVNYPKAGISIHHMEAWYALPD